MERQIFAAAKDGKVVLEVGDFSRGIFDPTIKSEVESAAVLLLVSKADLRGYTFSSSLDFPEEYGVSDAHGFVQDALSMARERALEVE